MTNLIRAMNAHATAVVTARLGRICARGALLLSHGASRASELAARVASAWRRASARSSRRGRRATIDAALTASEVRTAWLELRHGGREAVRAALWDARLELSRFLSGTPNPVPNMLAGRWGGQVSRTRNGVGHVLAVGIGSSLLLGMGSVAGHHVGPGEAEARSVAPIESPAEPSATSSTRAPGASALYGREAERLVIRTPGFVDADVAGPLEDLGAVSPGTTAETHHGTLAEAGDGAPAAMAGAVLGEMAGAVLGEMAGPALEDAADAFHLDADEAALAPASNERRAPTAATTTRRRSPMERQLDFARVRSAAERHRESVRRLLAAHGIDQLAGLHLRGFKREQVLEVWVRPLGEAEYRHVRTYPICALSGSLGPKVREGDRQVPEGLYHVDGFNPVSDYRLSLHIDYPNRADRQRNRGRNPGGAIYIHGGCASIGCLAITDEAIEELYWIALLAADNGQARIPIHLFPVRMDEAGVTWLRATYGQAYLHWDFWMSLRPAFEAFESTRRLPTHHIGARGAYVVHAGEPQEDDLGGELPGSGGLLGAPVVSIPAAYAPELDLNQR